MTVTKSQPRHMSNTWRLMSKMIDRRGKKQMTVMMPTELGKHVERIVEENEEMTEASFTREAMRRELQRYEKEECADE